MDKFSEEDYRKQLWPPLEEAVKMLLVQQPGVYLKISYEEMYRHVYTSVCNQHSALIYADLLSLLCEQLAKFSDDLETLTGASLVENFHTGLKRFTQAIGCIVPIFAYLNRTYVTLQRKSDLKRELSAILNTTIVEKHVHRVLSELDSIQSQPFGFNPSAAADLISYLYDARPDFARIHPHVFAKFIPNILRPHEKMNCPCTSRKRNKCNWNY
ncbi:putative CDK2-associated and cullin domain-containing protein 1 [Apostichopus japonicus]|uniref:Putative CDK2-associated and cullin domain-containing protein 1 n=1 Tax=Stichopus japonicus TaxID=307972 RepID=A0A2G8K7T9_STIJA|nr:putative CDK2-associated and cullin domain-containing protein 1 [Apostichopus japonicus]